MYVLKKIHPPHAFYSLKFDFTVKTRPGRKAFLIGMALISMHELCGCFTMLNYTATIFRESGSTISPNFSAVIVGFIQLLGTYVATFSVDRFGRKVLLISSSIGSAVCLCGLGTYSYLNSIGVDVSMYSWMAIVSFSGMMFLAAIGLIPLMPVVISEVMPEQVIEIDFKPFQASNSHSIRRYETLDARYASACHGCWPSSW